MPKSRLLSVAVLLALVTMPLAAQFAPAPTLDGTVTDGEYSHSSGNWFMTWDATYLYIGQENLGSSSNLTSVYLDVDSLTPTPAGGSNANGNLTSYPEEVPALTNTITLGLPFRADARIHATQSSIELRTRDGEGGWSSANMSGTDVTVVNNSLEREIRIRWAALPGLFGPTATFHWLAFKLEGTFVPDIQTTLIDPVPPANPTGTPTVYPYFHSVTDADVTSANSPFDTRYSTWKVTSNADSGAGTLRQAITDANADDSSAQRYVTFGLSGSTTIQLESALPDVTEITAIDGLTQTNSLTPAVVVRGLNTNPGNNGITISGTTGIIRGLILQNHFYGIKLDNASEVLIDKNYVGTNATGTAAAPNAVGIGVLNSFISTIDGNVVSGNINDGIYLDGGGINVLNNIIGRSAGNTSAIPNSFGITTHGANHLIGDPTTPNVIASNAVGVNVDNDGGVVIRGNSMFENTSNAVVIGPAMPAPSIISAFGGGDSLAIVFDLASSANYGTVGSVRLDLYEADTTTNIPQGRTWRATQCFVGANFDDTQWDVNGAWGAGEKIVLTATGYTGTDCTSPSEGTSAFTPFFTTTGRKTFRGFGDFSDITKWSTAELPLEGEDFIVIGGCVIDGDYGPFDTIYLGSASTGGALILSAGNELTAHTIRPMVTGSSIDMNAGGLLSIEGSLETTGLSFLAGDGQVAYVGTDQTLAPLKYHDVLIEGSVTEGSGTAVILGELAIQSGAVFTPNGGTVELRDGEIVNLGMLTFATLSIPSGFEGGTESSFAVATSMVVNGTFDPQPTAAISGAGTLSGTGLIEVTGTASPDSYASQYTLTKSSNLSVAFTGAAKQYVGGRQYNDLVIENDFGADAASGVQVNGTLTLEEGVLASPQSGAVQVENTSTTAVVAVDGWVGGWLTRRASPNSSYSYPVGTSTISTPITATFPNGLGAGHVKIGAVAGEHPQIATAAIDTNRNLNVYWSTQVVDTFYSSYSITLNFPASSYDATATPTAFVLRGYNTETASWFGIGASPSASSISAPGLTAIAAPPTDLVAGNTFVNSYHLATSAAPLHAGTPFTTTVTARDAFHYTVADASGSVTMTVTGSAQFDSNGDATFGDNVKSLANGVFTISTKDNAIESTTLTATDGNGKTGSVTVSVERGPASATTTEISASPTQVTANGIATSTITVQAKDAGGNNQIVGGAGVTLDATQGTIGTITDHNNGTYTATYTAGTLAGTATITGTINGIEIADTATVTLNPGPATSLLVQAPATATGGTQFTITVIARDAKGNTATGYTGTVHFISTATSAVLPSDYTFTGANAGVKTFNVTLSSAGNITLTATDTITASITGSDIIAVSGNTSTALQSSPNPSTGGQSVTFTATVTSATTGAISGTVTFKDGATTLGTGTATNGVATFSTPSLSVGSHSITAEYGGSSSFNASTSAPLSQTVNASPFGPPVFFTAAATSSTQINLSWTAVSGAISYRIYRNTGAGYTLFTSTNATSFNDGSVSANTAYTYKVSTFNGTTESGLSNADVATTVIFGDGALSGVRAKAVHITQLRTAVNALRTLAGIGAATFTDPSLAAGMPIQRVHIVELRTALNAARSTLILPALSYTDPTITPGSTTLKAAHVTELRAGTQ